jgi:hypothetical protein
MGKLNENSKKKLIRVIVCALIIIILGTSIIPLTVDLVLCSQLKDPIFAEFLNEQLFDEGSDEYFSGKGYYIVVSRTGPRITEIYFRAFIFPPIHFIE